MKILVLGGDGYLGWPTALHLSALGHEVTVVDNLVRREYDREMGVDSLVPIASLQDRVTRSSSEAMGTRLSTPISRSYSRRTRLSTTVTSWPRAERCRAVGQPR